MNEARNVRERKMPCSPRLAHKAPVKQASRRESTSTSVGSVLVDRKSLCSCGPIYLEKWVKGAKAGKKCLVSGKLDV